MLGRLFAREGDAVMAKLSMPKAPVWAINLTGALIALVSAWIFSAVAPAASLGVLGSTAIVGAVFNVMARRSGAAASDAKAADSADEKGQKAAGRGAKQVTSHVVIGLVVLLLVAGIVAGLETFRRPIGRVERPISVVMTDLFPDGTGPEDPAPEFDAGQKLRILVDFVGSECRIQYVPMGVAKGRPKALRSVAATTQAERRGVGLDEVVALATTDAVGPSVAVEVHGLPQGTFWSARAANNVTVTTYAGEDDAEWTLPDLRHGVAFTYVRPPAQFFRSVIGPVFGLRSSDEVIVMFAAGLITPALLALGATLPRLLVAIVNQAVGGD